MYELCTQLRLTTSLFLKNKRWDDEINQSINQGFYRGLSNPNILFVSADRKQQRAQQIVRRQQIRATDRKVTDLKLFAPPVGKIVAPPRLAVARGLVSVWTTTIVTQTAACERIPRQVGRSVGESDTSTARARRLGDATPHHLPLPPACRQWRNHELGGARQISKSSARSLPFSPAIRNA